MELVSGTWSEQDYEARDAHWTLLVRALRERLLQLEASGSLSGTDLSEPLQHEFLALAETAYLSVWLDAYDGHGSWNQLLPVDTCEPWSLEADGTAILSGNVLTIAELVEAFASKLTAHPQ